MKKKSTNYVFMCFQQKKGTPSSICEGQPGFYSLSKGEGKKERCLKGGTCVAFQAVPCWQRSSRATVPGNSSCAGHVSTEAWETAWLPRPRLAPWALERPQHQLMPLLLCVVTSAPPGGEPLAPPQSSVCAELPKEGGSFPGRGH